jgi:hypothetical protein
MSLAMIFSGRRRNQRFNESLVEGEGEFESMYLDDINDDMNPGVICKDDQNTPSPEDYKDMHTDERPEDDDEEAVDKYLNVELIGNIGTNDKQRGRMRLTRGWFLLVQWRDGSVVWWENLKDLKASNPVEVAEYAVVNQLVKEPAFKWWVPHMLSVGGTESSPR